MAATDLQREALDIALRHADPEIGVHIWCQLVTAPAKPGHRQRNGQHEGPIPVWHLLMTISDPTNLVGPKLRHMRFIGDGAPNLAVIKGEVENGARELRDLARQRLAQANN